VQVLHPQSRQLTDQRRQGMLRVLVPGDDRRAAQRHLSQTGGPVLDGGAGTTTWSARTTVDIAGAHEIWRTLPAVEYLTEGVEMLIRGADSLRRRERRGRRPGRSSPAGQGLTSDASARSIVHMRTTLDLDGSVLEQLRARQRREGTSLGRLASELLAKALADTEDGAAPAPLAWVAQPMAPRVDLEDRDAVQAILDADR
jgi:hypothetical protein